MITKVPSWILKNKLYTISVLNVIDIYLTCFKMTLSKNIDKLIINNQRSKINKILNSYLKIIILYKC